MHECVVLKLCIFFLHVVYIYIYIYIYLQVKKVGLSANFGSDSE
jgi:hypothetical protein